MADGDDDDDDDDSACKDDDADDGVQGHCGAGDDECDDDGDGDDGEESDPFQTQQRRFRELIGTILFRHSNVDLESLLAHSWLCSIAGLI